MNSQRLVVKRVVFMVLGWSDATLLDQMVSHLASGVSYKKEKSGDHFRFSATLSPSAILYIEKEFVRRGIGFARA